MKTFKKQFNIKTKLKTLDLYIRSILNKFGPDDEVEVDIQEFNGKQNVKVKILDWTLIDEKLTLLSAQLRQKLVEG